MHISVGSDVALTGPDHKILAIMSVTDLYRPDQTTEVQLVYGTDNPEHPGVAAIMEAGGVYLGGAVSIVGDMPRGKFEAYKFTPAQTRAAFAERGWNTVVAFQTRNPIHRAHEYITKTALESIDGLFINPLVGTTKSDDVPATVRMQCYEVLINRYYNKEKVFLGVYPAAMRYGGPREAILHAVSRQNYGCTHLIVGRDHAGVGDYYGPYDAQNIFDGLPKGALKIAPIKFEHVFFCKRTRQMATRKTTSSTPEERVHFSGTMVRSLLSNGKLPPPEFSRPEVAEILMRAYRENRVSADSLTPYNMDMTQPIPSRASKIIRDIRSVDKTERAALKTQRPCILWFTGLCSAGKSTVANALEASLITRGYHTYLLDGDDVRRGLNINLGFSAEDRKENIRRIGEVAKLFVDAGIIVLTAFISPYRSDRDIIRNNVKEGEFLEIFVNTPLHICESRDPKGLYKKARAGEIQGFTGIDDPYEPPINPEIIMCTNGKSVDESVLEILRELEARNVIMKKNA